MPLEKVLVLPQIMLLAVANNISKANYQTESVLYVCEINLGRFVDVFMEIFNKNCYFSSIFIFFWACINRAAFPQVNCFSVDRMLKVFGIIPEVKTYHTIYRKKQKNIS